MQLKLETLNNEFENLLWQAFEFLWRSLFFLYEHPIQSNTLIVLIIVVLALSLAGRVLLEKDKNFVIGGIRLLANTTFWTIVISSISTILAVLVLYAFVPEFSSYLPDMKKAFFAIVGRGKPWAGGTLACGVISYILIMRYFDPSLSSRFDRWRKRKYNIYQVPSARNIESTLPPCKSFNLIKYFTKAKKKDAIFIGINVKAKPAFVPCKDFYSSHLLVIGFTGFGKGAFVNSLLWQSISRGNTTVAFQPKVDEWAASVLSAACTANGQQLIRVNLNELVPSINPILGCTEQELFELFVSIFDLVTSSKESDFHKLKDRKGARLLVKAVSGSCNVSLLEVSRNAEKLLGEFTKECTGFLTQVEELSEMIQVNPKSGVNLRKNIEDGCCLLIEGNVSDESIKRLTKLIFARVIQVSESRKDTERQVTIFCDELRHLICAKYLQALATSRDKNINIISACQSIADLEVPQAGYEAQTVKNTILDNKAFKWCYRANYETAEWIAKQAGTEPVKREIISTSTNVAISETSHDEKKIIDDEAALIHTNQILNLPKFMAVSIGLGKHAEISRTDIVKVDKIDVPIFADSGRSIEPQEDLL